MSTNGQITILDIIPKTIHDPAPFIVGSLEDVQEYKNLCSEVTSLSLFKTRVLFTLQGVWKGLTILKLFSIR